MQVSSITVIKNCTKTESFVVSHAKEGVHIKKKKVALRNHREWECKKMRKDFNQPELARLVEIPRIGLPGHLGIFVLRGRLTLQRETEVIFSNGLFVG